MGPTTALSAGFWSGGAALQLLWLVWPTWFLSVPALWFWLASSSVAVWALARREHAAAAWVCLAAPVVCVLLWVGTILTLNASM